jgi:hypothetical protein
MGKNDRNDITKIAADIAAQRPAAPAVGMELYCEMFETGEAVTGKVIGADDRWVRLKLDEIGREWLVRPDRIDLAKGTWQHLAADYPQIAADPEFDREFRPTLPPKGPSVSTSEIGAAADKLKAHLPEALRGLVDDVVQGATDRVLGGPGDAKLARWTGRGKLDAVYLDRKTRTPKRGAEHGTEGWFRTADLAKFSDHFDRL